MSGKKILISQQQPKTASPYASIEEKFGVTFDLYDVGLVFFDKSRVKEHRIVNFL